MKISNRFLLGVLSSLLLAAGLARAASQFDPVSQTLPGSTDKSELKGTSDCSGYCDIIDDENQVAP